MANCSLSVLAVSHGSPSPLSTKFFDADIDGDHIPDLVYTVGYDTYYSLSSSHDLTRFVKLPYSLPGQAYISSAV